MVTVTRTNPRVHTDTQRHAGMSIESGRCFHMHMSVQTCTDIETQTLMDNVSDPDAHRHKHNEAS